jgi:hypothetical protein
MASAVLTITKGYTFGSTELVTHTKLHGMVDDGTFTNSVASDGTTGGSSSAGAGNQYVELTVGASVYKLLHDGTV